MPFDDDAVPMGLTPQLAEPAEVSVPAPPFSKLFEKALERDNPWVSMAQSATQPGKAPFDPNYDPFRNISGYEDYASSFTWANTDDDVAHIKHRIDTERKRDEFLASGGWRGTVASIGAGLFDPLMMVPVGGELVAITRTGRALSGAIRTGATFGGVTAAQEALLHGSQITRNPLESAINVATSTVMGGVVGGAFGAVMTRDLARSGMRAGETFERELTANTGGEVPLGGSVGSATIPRYQMGLDDLTIANALGVPNALARTSPTLRLGTSPSEEVRRIALELADQPLDLRANAAGVPTPISVERLIMQHLGPLAESMQGLDDSFVQYRLGRDRQRFDMTRLAARDVIAGALGRERTMLTYDEFKEAIGRAMRRGDVSDIPEVAEAARLFRQKVFDPLKERAIAAGLLPEDVTPEGAVSYFSRMYNTAKISAQRTQFEKILTDWLNTTSHDPNLTQLDLQDIARQVTDQLMNMGPNRSSYGGIVPLARGPLKGRTLAIPDHLIEDYLEHDVGRIARAYTRTMAADVELTRAFGRADMQDQLDKVREHYAVLRAAARGKVIPATPAAGALEGGIAGDWERQLVAAGRPQEEAAVAGDFIQAYYERRAAEPQFRGITAEELYRRDMAQVRAGEAGEGLAAGELGQRGVTETVKVDNATEAARGDQGQSLPARVPTGKDAPANRWTDADAIPDLATLQSNERLFENTVNAVGDEVGMGHNGGPPLVTGAPAAFANIQEKSEYLIGRLKDNLLWLWDQVPPEIRERSRLWYDGAQAIATEWGERWNKTRSQTSGMLAVLSPQKDWFMNTTMAERIGDIMHLHGNHRWDDLMDSQAFKFLLGETSTSAENRAAYAAIKGKTLREVMAAGGPIEHLGMWLRAYDEAYHGAAHSIITPEGAYAGNMLTQARDEARRAWGDFSAIGKAASIFMDGSPENISLQIGMEHKVRNFYNNIFHAMDPRYVTIDTHAVAADLLRPLAGKDKAVQDNFGGTGSDRATGLAGSYALHAEAYRRAAAERGVHPREIQSVTWEAIRGMFPDDWKTQANKDAVDAIWAQVGPGFLSVEDARAEVYQLAQGIREPEWVGSGVDPMGRTTTYAATREPPKGAIVTFEVAPDPRNPALVARWQAVPQELRDWISHQVAWQIGADILTGAGEGLWGVGGRQRRPNVIKGELHRNNGAWKDDANPSLALHLEPNTPAEKVGIIARLVGYSLQQEETLRTAPKSFRGGTDTGVVILQLPRDATPAEIHAVHQQIRELTHANGEPYVLGHTTSRARRMEILNNNTDAPIDTAELARLIDEKLGGKYDIETGTLQAERVQAGDNEYGLSGSQVGGGAGEEGSGQSLRRAADNLRASAQQQIDQHLASYESGAAGRAREPAAAAELGAAGAELGAAGPRGPPDTGAGGRGGTESADAAQRSAAEAAGRHPALVGLPVKSIKIGDAFYVPGPLARAKEAALNYMRRAGLLYDPPRQYVTVDPERAARIAEAFEQMKHDPDDPAVKASYAALVKETLAQWQAIKETGLVVEWIKPGQVDPYAATPRLAAMDVLHNNHWWGFPTELGFGTEDATARAKHPMLQLTDEVVDGRRLLVNDVFRIVHDYFGHFKEGVGFRASGEENAWRAHAAMYSELARGAMTSETRGQNSWVNYGPHGEVNRTASAADTIYSPQKVGLLPDWVMEEGRADVARAAATELEQAGPFRLEPAQPDDLGYPYGGPGADGKVYKIIGPDGQTGILQARIQGETAIIDDIFDISGGRNFLGAPAVRDLLQQFLADNPGVRRISGERVSGARFGGATVEAGSGVRVEIGVPGTELEQAGRGKIRLASAEAKALMTLFRNAADASTAFHEFAHHAATQFFKDAAHELASPALRADARAFERWLGMEEGATVLTREQQEQFATGMEQFLRDGTAPTKQLEGAFAKIKAWMQSIYQNITDLGTPIPDEIREAFGRMFAAPEKELPPVRFEGDPAIRALNTREAADLRDLEAVRDRVRGTYGLPDNPNGLWNRTYHVLKDVNYLRLLGGMTVSAFPDMGRTVMTHGLMRVLGDGILPMLRNFTQYRLASNELKLAGNALDMVLDTRAMSLADMMDDYGRWSKYERGLKGMTERFGLVSLMAPWNAALKQFVGVVGQTRTLEAIEKLVAGEAIRPAETTRLASLGIGRDMAERINTMFQEHGTKGDAGTAWWANTSAWPDKGAAEVYRAAMSKEVDTAIVTPGQERPLWTTSGNTWRLLGQFHSFSLASTQRVMMTGLQKRDMATLNGALIMVGLGMMSFLIGRAANPSAPPLPDLNTPGGWAQLMREGVDKSGLLGWLFDVHNIVEKASRGGVGLSRLTGGPPMSRYASRGVVESLLGPTVGLAEAATTALGSAGSGEWAGSDTKAVRRMLPFQNLIYLRWLFDAAEAGLNRSFGVREQALPRR